MLQIDFAGRAVVHRGLPVRLTPLEFRVLAALARHAGQVLSIEQILEQAWGTTVGVSPEQVKLYVSYLRRKLGAAGDGSSPIETMRGFGYRYAPPLR